MLFRFEMDGSLGKDYGFYGKISDASINLTKQFSIKNLTAKINELNDNDGQGYRNSF